MAQTIAVTCLGLKVDCVLTGLKTLLIKETNRLLALKNEIKKLGTKVTITDDSLSFSIPNKIIDNVSIDTYQDHRMAMSFAPLSLLTNISINNPDVVSKSYPNFWNDLEKIGVKINIEIRSFTQLSLLILLISRSVKTFKNFTTSLSSVFLQNCQ